VTSVRLFVGFPSTAKPGFPSTAQPGFPSTAQPGFSEPRELLQTTYTCLPFGL